MYSLFQYLISILGGKTLFVNDNLIWSGLYTLPDIMDSHCHQNRQYQKRWTSAVTKCKTVVQVHICTILWIPHYPAKLHVQYCNKQCGTLKTPCRSRKHLSVIFLDSFSFQLQLPSTILFSVPGKLMACVCESACVHMHTCACPPTKAFTRRRILAVPIPCAEHHVKFLGSSFLKIRLERIIC